MTIQGASHPPLARVPSTVIMHLTMTLNYVLHLPSDSLLASSLRLQSPLNFSRLQALGGLVLASHSWLGGYTYAGTKAEDFKWINPLLLLCTPANSLLLSSLHIQLTNSKIGSDGCWVDLGFFS